MLYAGLEGGVDEGFALGLFDGGAFGAWFEGLF